MQSKVSGMNALSELVWSPDEGLCIKIAASSLSTRKTSLRWNADALSIVISSPQQSGSGGKSGDNIDATLGDAEKMPSELRTRGDSSVRVSTASPNRIRNLDAQQSTSIRSQEQDSKCCGGINLMNEGREVSDNCCVDKLEKEEELGSCPTRCSKEASHSSASGKEVMHSIAETQVYCATTVHAERSWADNAWRARLVKAISQRDSVLPKNADNTQSPSSFGNLDNAENIPGKLTGFLGNKNDNLGDQVMQESHKDEPIVARCESASGVNPVAKYESTSGANPRKLEKGKEKVMDDQSNCVSNTKEGDDSNESVESCPSTKAPKRKHVQCSTAEMSSGNKRSRREDNGSSCSGLLHRNGSSFFNWMSSLTNGLTMFNETTTAVPLDQKFSAATGEEFAAHPLPLQNNSSIPLQSVGFNSLFQSLYSNNVMITSRNTCHQSESNCTERVPNRLMLSLKGGNSMLDKQISMGRETLDVAPETLAADSLQMGSGSDKGNFQNQIGIFPLRTERNLKLPNSSKSCSRSLEEKQNKFHASSSNAAMGNTGGFTESLWISRFLPKTSMKLMDATPCNVKGDFGAVNPKGIGDKLCYSSMQNFNMEKEFSNAQYFTSKGSDNGTTSSKCPAMHPEEHKQSETKASIFAKRLDALRHAKTSAIQLAITCDNGMSKACNHRTSSFVVSYSSHDGLEARQGTHKSSGDGRLVLWIGEKGKEQFCNESDEELRGKVLSEREHQHCGRSTAGKGVAPYDNLEANKSAQDIDGRVKIKEGASNSMESVPDSKQICDESSLVFGALQRLRLSRSDIIRWLKSPIMHTTLEGFFLRLRFGKWEEALGGTIYHVARINGALDRNRLSVTVRNSTCLVDSRFVSNHDFHEDELKAWWSAAMKGGWKLPSKEELNMKLRERELLHF